MAMKDFITEEELDVSPSQDEDRVPFVSIKELGKRGKKVHKKSESKPVKTEEKSEETQPVETSPEDSESFKQACSSLDGLSQDELRKLVEAANTRLNGKQPEPEKTEIVPVEEKARFPFYESSDNPTRSSSPKVTNSSKNVPIIQSESKPEQKSEKKEVIKLIRVTMPVVHCSKTCESRFVSIKPVHNSNSGKTNNQPPLPYSSTEVPGVGRINNLVLGFANVFFGK